MGTVFSKTCQYPECSLHIYSNTKSCLHHICPVIICDEPKEQFKNYCSSHSNVYNYYQK